jgi:hypothetical protein
MDTTDSGWMKINEFKLIFEHWNFEKWILKVLKYWRFVDIQKIVEQIEKWIYLRV